MHAQLVPTASAAVRAAGTPRRRRDCTVPHTGVRRRLLATRPHGCRGRRAPNMSGGGLSQKRGCCSWATATATCDGPSRCGCRRGQRPLLLPLRLPSRCTRFSSVKPILASSLTGTSRLCKPVLRRAFALGAAWASRPHARASRSSASTGAARASRPTSSPWVEASPFAAASAAVTAANSASRAQILLNAAARRPASAARAAACRCLRALR